MNIYQFPEKAKVNRIIPKNKFYTENEANSKIKNLFVTQIDKIIWAYKLSSATLSIEAGENMKEFQIFHLYARQEKINEEVLAYIDKSIPSSIIFEIYYQDNIQLAGAYKRQNQNEKEKVVLNEYYYSDNLPQNIEREPLPLFLNLGDLYAHFIQNLLPFSPIQNETKPAQQLEHNLEQAKQAVQLQQEIAMLNKKLQREKQFNRKVDINLQIQALKKQLHQMGLSV